MEGGGGGQLGKIKMCGNGERPQLEYEPGPCPPACLCLLPSPRLSPSRLGTQRLPSPRLETKIDPTSSSSILPPSLPLFPPYSLPARQCLQVDDANAARPNDAHAHVLHGHEAAPGGDAARMLLPLPADD